MTFLIKLESPPGWPVQRDVGTHGRLSSVLPVWALAPARVWG